MATTTVDQQESPGTERRQLLASSSARTYTLELEEISQDRAAVLAPSNASGDEESPEREEGTDAPASTQSPSQECGFVFLFKKFLNLLPAFGDEGEDEEKSEDLLRYGATQIINLLAPVTICMAVVLLFVVSVELQTPVSATSSSFEALVPGGSSTTGGTVLITVVSVAIIVTLVILMTVVLVLLFKYKCYKVIYAWLLVVSVLLLFFFATLYLLDICVVHNLALDWLSWAFCIWNFGVMGIVVIHWKGPLRLQQAYLIVVCALAATRLLKYLPEWTTWLLLFVISIWDIIAVLCPKGPLRVLVETAQERNVEIFPALIYSSTMIWLVGMADAPRRRPRGEPSINKAQGDMELTGESLDSIAREDSSASLAGSEQRQPPGEGGQASAGDGASEENRESTEEETKERRGVKLGLGDFIFYSLLLGKAAYDSSGDWAIVSACFVAILVGLCLTTILLGMVRRALPALPISIIFGLIFYFTSRYLLSPFAVILATKQVYL